MPSDPSSRHTSGFKEQTSLADAQERLFDNIRPIDRTEHVSLAAADGRILAEPIVANRDVPHYRRAAMDGYAVQASDTFGANSRSPAVLSEDEEMGTGTAVRVHTGSPVPDEANAVVKIEEVNVIGNTIEVNTPVAEGENVAPVGEDVTAGQQLFDAGHQLRPSDLGLLQSIGLTRVSVYDTPTVGVIPTGDELVQQDPQKGEIIETNGLTVSRLVDRWGGISTYRDPVSDDKDALRAAIQRDLTKDLIVTTGGSSVGERDLLPEVVDELGEILVHGVSIKPGHPVALGVVESTPIIILPGYPVSCIVNAVQFLRPALKRLVRVSPPDHPTVTATLDRKISSEPGTRTFARVELSDSGDKQTAIPTRSSGAGVLSSVALADGWVEVPEAKEGVTAGESVTVSLWEWLP